MNPIVHFFCRYFEVLWDFTITPRDGGMLWLAWSYFLIPGIPILGMIVIVYFIIRWTWKEVL